MSSTGNPRGGKWGSDESGGSEIEPRRHGLRTINGGKSAGDHKVSEGFARFFGKGNEPEHHGAASLKPLLADTGEQPVVETTAQPLLADPIPTDPPQPPTEPVIAEAQPLSRVEAEARSAAASSAPSATGAEVALPQTRRARRLAQQALEQGTPTPAEAQTQAAGLLNAAPATQPETEVPQPRTFHVASDGAAAEQPKTQASVPTQPRTPAAPPTRTPRRQQPVAALPGISEAERLARELGLPTVDLSEYPVEAEAVGLVPENICRRDHLLPIGRMENSLLVAMADPRNVVAIDDVTARTGLKVVPMVAGEAAISAAIDRYHRLDSEMAELKDVITSEASERTRAVADDDVDDDDDAPIIRFVNLLISQAIMDHASDIHIEPHRDGLVVRYRIDGVLHEVQHASTAMVAGVISRLKVMASLDIAERRKPQDGRISVAHAGKSVDLRVATLPTVWGEKIVMRILDSSIGTKRLEDLAMSPRNLEVFRTSFTRPHGMVLVTGPTGSGKSTTLYTAVGAVARPEVNVITVEDPVEFRMEGINQVQVNVKAGLTFAGALRSILRSDPDVVLIGEIRDRETAQIAIEASLTGHLVLSTLHTNNAPSAITRLVEMGVEPFLVGSAMECVVAQRLARRLCPKCAEEYVPDAETLASLHLPAGIEAPTFWRPVGCHACANTGYKGRIAIHEVMHVDDRIERLTVGDAAVSDIADYAVSQGMATLRQDGLVKAAQGLTSVDEVLRVTA